MILLSGFSFLEMYALEPPKMQCLKLQNNNQDMHVAYSKSDDCHLFKSYHFYLNGVLLKIETVDDSMYSLCDYGGTVLQNIPFAEHYNCWIVAVDFFGNEYNSDTLKSISLTVTPNTDNTLATLSWESPSQNLDNSWGTVFKLYKKRSFEQNFPPTPFATISNTQLQYIDTSDVCNDTLYYQVGISHHYYDNNNLTNCPFMTTIGSAFLKDGTTPQKPTLDSVSVTPTNEVILGFHENEPNMKGFIIYYETPNGYLALDTVYNQTFWIDNSFDPSQEIRSYRIAAIDSCNNSSPQIDVNTEMQGNIKLNINNTDICNKTAIISWNGYKNMLGGIGNYEIYISEDPTQSWVLLDSTLNHSYMVDNLELNKDYFIFVKAKNQNGNIRASSNRVNLNITAEETDDFSYIRSVSVIDNRFVRIKLFTSGLITPFNKITLEKSDDGVVFEDFITLPYNNSADYIFADSSFNFNKNIRYYRTYLTDNCNTKIAFSNISHNILLKGEAMTQSNSITWQSYDGWDGALSGYYILRKTERDDGYNTLSYQSGSTVNIYIDDVSQDYETGSKFSYFIEAREDINQYGFSESSFSNQISLTQAPTLFIPNAFRPAGNNNRVFQPINSFVSPDNYLLAIYNRTGELIFFTTNPQEGWDGRRHTNGQENKILPLGVYIYHIEYKLTDGTMVERNGTITLLR